MIFGKYIAAFTIINILSVIVNIRFGFDGLVLNTAFLINGLFYLVIFYGAHTENRNVVKKELYTVCKFLLVATSACALIGFVLLALFHQAIWIWGNGLIIFENRFKGIYTNPNLQAFQSFTGIFSCVILRCRGFLKDIGEKPVRLRYITACVVLNIMSIFLSDSNSSILILSSFLIGICCYFIFGGRNIIADRKIALRTAALAVCSFVIVAGLILSRDGFKFLASTVLSTDPIISIESLKPTADELGSQLTIDGTVTFDHINHNIDSGRLKLFSKAGNYISNYPVFGIGRGNIILFNLGHSRKMLDFHNGYLTITVSGGLAAFAVFLCFGLRIAKRMSIGIFTYIPPIRDNILPYTFSFICAYCIYSMVEKTLMYDSTYMVGFFWFVLGAAFAVFQDYEPQLQKEKRRQRILKKKKRRSDIKEKLHLKKARM